MLGATLVGGRRHDSFQKREKLRLVKTTFKLRVPRNLGNS